MRSKNSPKTTKWGVESTSYNFFIPIIPNPFFASQLIYFVHPVHPVRNKYEWRSAAKPPLTPYPIIRNPDFAS